MVARLLYIHSSQFTHHDGEHEYFTAINRILFVRQWNSFDIAKYISNAHPVDNNNVDILTRVALSLVGLSCKYWYPISYNSATHLDNQICARADVENHNTLFDIV